MTKHDLKQIYYIDREIKMWQRKLDEMNNKSYVGTPKLTGTPNGTVVQNKVEADAIERAELSAKIAKLQCQQQEITEYINGIDDSIVRQIITLKYVELKSWTQVVMAIGGGNTKEGLRKKLYRFLKNN